MNLTPLIITFILIMIAELGDKTQLVVITLCSKWSRTLVFLGAMLGFLLVDGLSVLVGEALAIILPTFWIKLGSGIIFIFSGIFTLFSNKEKVEEKEICSYHFTILSVFLLVSLMELGDKTQLMVIVLSAQYNAPLLIFLGVMLAFGAVTGMGVAIGGLLQKIVPQKYVKIIAASVFILFGLLLLVNVFLGSKIL